MSYLGKFVLTKLTGVFSVPGLLIGSILASCFPGLDIRLFKLKTKGTRTELERLCLYLICSHCQMVNQTSREGWGSKNMDGKLNRFYLSSICTSICFQRPKVQGWKEYLLSQTSLLRVLDQLAVFRFLHDILG